MKNKKSNMAGVPQQEQTIACVSSIAARSQASEMRPLFREGLNAEELISQINYRSSNETSNNTNRCHNTSNNNNTSNSNTNNNNNNNNQQTIRGSIDIEKGSLRRFHHRHRPLYRRFFSFIRNMWMGAKFSAKADCELEELEASPRYRPESLSSICKNTKFTESEIKRIYRGFKAECPNGVVKEENFKFIYGQFFPQGANTGLYAHYVFNTLDKDHTGILSFEKFVQGLSILSRGTMEEKLCWTFSLYDIDGDGRITREEMTDIVTSVYGLLGHTSETINEEKIKEKVERIFHKMDRNKDGVVTIDEFLDCCRHDQAISNSMLVFDSCI